ncbi:MAG: S8 family serine peptidase, partial [Myxococcota bacterium]
QSEPEPPSLDPASYQWHFAHAGADDWLWETSDLTVAVLDSVVDYEDHADALGTYVQAPSLADIDIVAPADFVNGDSHANDDHRHGTHIASLIVSEGAVRGVAAGTALMPVKVLDANNQGDELSLIEGIYHATDHGADVINMSLSFGTGFVPSAELQASLSYAAKRGTVLVAAAGNAGAEQVSWPAASPSVIAVGATTPQDASDQPMLPSYANRGAVDVLAPGGDVGVDRNGDGFQDGLLAETFAPGDPTAIGYWFQAGTSQAAAFVSGAALQLLRYEVPPDQVRTMLQDGASTHKLGHGPFEAGTGAGLLDVDASLREAFFLRLTELERRYVSVMPYITRSGEELQPWARVTVVDDAGEPVPGARVHVLATGSTTDRRSCTTDTQGQCSMMAPRLYADPSEPAAWSWEVETVEHQGLSAPLGTVMFADLPLEVLLESVEQDDELRDAMLAVHWPAGHDDDLGDIVESYTLTNRGTGMLTAPLGLVFTPGALGQHQLSMHEMSLDGTGMLSAPLGFVTMRRLVIDLEDSPLMSLAAHGGEMVLIAADGSGMLAAPLGFVPRAMFEPLSSSPHWASTMDGSGMLSMPLGFRSSPVFLSTFQPISSTLAGTALGDILAAGGWTDSEGRPAGTAALGAGVVPMSTAAEADLSSGERLE